MCLHITLPRLALSFDGTHMSRMKVPSLKNVIIFRVNSLIIDKSIKLI